MASNPLEQKWPPNPSEYDWKNNTIALRIPGTEVKRLEREGILIKRDEVFKQSFEAYTSPEIAPFFITTDSLLNGYHVLLESSLQRAAMQKFKLLKTFLIELLEGVKASGGYDRVDPDKRPEIIAHAERVLGPALILLGEKPRFINRQVEKDVHDVVARIQQSTTVWLPHWLEPANADLLAIDFRRMKPIGFFTRHPNLSAYFQAMQWLRSVPFRLDRDLELFTYGCLANVSFHNYELRRINKLASFFGEPNGVDLENAGSSFQNFRRSLYSGDEEGARSFALAMLQTRDNLPIERVEDSWRLIPRERGDGFSYKLYLFVPRVLPDSALFQDLMQQPWQADSLPKGLYWAAFLGSDWASGKIGNEIILKEIAKRKAARDLAFEGKKFRVYGEWAGEEMLKSIKRNSDLAIYAEVDNLYSSYTEVLESLFLDPEPESPEWMTGEVWKRKSTETALASWAQMRHSLSLISARGAMYMGLITAPPGFVEPNPEFYGRMAKLVTDTRDILKSSGVLGNPQLDGLFRLQASLDFIDKNIEEKSRLLDSLDSQEEKEGWSLQAHNLPVDPEILYDSEPASWSVKKWTKIRLIVLKKLEVAKAELDGQKSGHQDPMEDRWNDLLELSLTLESLAHKQLRGVDWNEREANFIRNYGERLAGVMLYEGNSWLTPVDDAPRIMGVYENPQVGKILHVGVGRPHAIYVLYPWKGTKVLCRGSMMPYFEFPASEWMANPNWKEQESETQHPVWLQD